MEFYDFAVYLKREYNKIKDKPAGEVPYSLAYIPWILSTTADVYRKHHKHYDFNELLSVAFTAAVEAEKNFDPTRETMFTTYAKYHVEPALNDYVSNMSKNQLTLLKKVQAFVEQYNKTNGYYPCEDIILKELKISKESFRLLDNNTEQVGIEDEEVIIGHDLSPEQILLLTDYFNAMEFIDIDYKGILKMRIIEELPFTLIGKKLKVSKEKAQSLYDEAIIELQKELEHRGMTKEDFGW